jgi:GntR family hexuronate regulon transcriptional repressor
MTNKRLYHTIADQIKDLIKEGALPPGSRLPGERELAQRFNVSRVTVREAEIVLQALGYLRIKTGSGAYVLDRSEKHSQGLPNVSAFELTEARLLFESEAAALAARNITEETLVHLDELIEEMSSEDPQDRQASQQADQKFHLAIAAASGNSAVQHIVETLWRMRTELPEVREVHAAICSDEAAKIRCAEHTEVLNALRNHDSTAARKAMQEHFKILLHSMIDVTEEMALEELRKKTTQSRQRFLNNVAAGDSS